MVLYDGVVSTTIYAKYSIISVHAQLCEESNLNTVFFHVSILSDVNFFLRSRLDSLKTHSLLRYWWLDSVIILILTHYKQ